jgi:peptide deformylase
MLLPIYAYGHPVLRKVCEDINANYINLTQLITNMWETMYHTNGMGLAAPQIGLPIRLFIIDTLQLDKEDLSPTDKTAKQVFINAEIIEEVGKEWDYEEGCLSIPDIRGKVKRKPQIKLAYLDENFQPQEQIFDGITARVIQHEYDHIEGRLFTDKLGLLKRQLINPALNRITKGQIKSKYKMVFPL